MSDPVELDSGIAETLLRAVEAQQPALVELTGALIACRTDSQSEDNSEFPVEARRCQEIVAAWLSDLGAEVQRWEEPPHYPVVAARLPGSGSGRTLAFNGHLDVVPVGDTSAWTHEPWGGEATSGRLWGRGAADMKGGVACALVAMCAIRESGVILAGDLWAHIVADEEVVGRSTRNLLQRLPAVDAVLVAEPTDLTVMPVEGGLIHFRIEIEGRESHAGNRYMSVHAGGLGDRAGVNAIEKMLRVVIALQDLERQWGNLRHHPMLPPGFNTIMPGIITGGPGGGVEGKLNLVSNPGTSPNYCSVEYNLWFLPGESFPAIRDEVESFVWAACQTDPWLREHPPRFTWKLRDIYFPPAETSPEHPVIQSLVAALEKSGRESRIEAFTAASELAWYAEVGIPGAIFGPGRIAQAHSPDEFVDLDQLHVACSAMTLGAVAWCGVTARSRAVQAANEQYGTAFA
jgi:acetylornithine deacetylase/succinyl-diaminopimelate desuccinylase family protein